MLYRVFLITVIIIYIPFYFVIPYGSCEEKDTARSLSLEGALTLAFSSNRDLLSLKQEIAAGEAALRNAKSTFFPHLDAIAGYTHRDAVMDLSGIPATNTDKDIGIFIGYNDEQMAGLTLQQPLFLGGKNRAFWHQAKLSIKKNEELLRAGRLSVEFEVKRLYYGVLLARETEQIARELLHQAEVHYADVLAKFKNGTSSRFDVLQSKVQIAKVSPAVVQAQNALELIKAQLNTVLGLDINTMFELKDPFELTYIDIDEKLFLSEAYTKRPELIMKKIGIDLSRESIAFARSASLPHINADANYTFRSDDVNDMFNDYHNNWSIGVTVKVPIFDGFSAKAKIEEAKARYEQAVLEKTDMAEQVAFEIRKACLDLKKTTSIITSQMEGIKEASEALSIANISFENGVITNLDVLDAQVSLSQVKKNLSEAIYDYIMARAFLYRTIGKSSLEECNDEK